MTQRLVRPRLWRLLLGLLCLTLAASYLFAQSRPQVARVGAAAAAKPVVGFTATTYAVQEDQGPALITVRVSSPPPAGKDIVVSYLTLPGTATEGPGGDFINTTGVLTFTHSSVTTQVFQVAVNNDTVINEPSETVNLVLTLLTPSTATLVINVAILIIVDDDVRFPVYLQPLFSPSQPTKTPAAPLQGGSVPSGAALPPPTARTWTSSTTPASRAASPPQWTAAQPASKLARVGLTC